MENWDVDADGNIRALDVHGYESATAPDLVLMRMLYVPPAPQPGGNQRPIGMQFCISPELARKLGEDLIANAERAEIRSAG